jgi:hypothetical protein
MRLLKFLMIRSLLAIFLVLIALGAEAQCAMCRAQLENNVSNGETGIAAGINIGILYLLAMPYLIAIVLGYLWYKSSKKNANAQFSSSIASR